MLRQRCRYSFDGALKALHRVGTKFDFFSGAFAMSDKPMMRPPLREPLLTRLQSKKGVVVFIIGLVGFISAILTFLPKVQIDIDSKYDPLSPFPASISVTNTGSVPLGSVSIFVRPCRVIGPKESNSVMEGSACKNAGAGGITMTGWRSRYLRTGVRWTIPMGRNVPFTFDTEKANILIVASYLPWPISELSFLWHQETVARLVTHKEPDGQIIWISIPVD
jgi:hypothetical protein